MKKEIRFIYSTKFLCPTTSNVSDLFISILDHRPGLLLQLSQQLGRGLLTVALGVVLGPEPQVLAGVLEGELGGPAELVVSASGVGRQVEDVTGTARSNLVGEVAANGGGEGTDHLVDGAALAGTQVPGANTGVVGAEEVQGLEVAVGQVENVDVVTDSSAVVGGVVCGLELAPMSF